MDPIIYTRICNMCKKEKLHSEMVMHKGKVYTKCRECNNQQTRERYERNKLKDIE